MDGDSFSRPKNGDFTGTLLFGSNGGSFAVALAGTGVKTGCIFNCAGGSETPGTDTGDLLVALMAVMALAGMHWKKAGQ